MANRAIAFRSPLVSSHKFALSPPRGAAINATTDAPCAIATVRGYDQRRRVVMLHSYASQRGELA